MINDEIKSLIKDAVSDYANSHWGHDDFMSERERIHYLEEISEGNGWNDDVEDEIYSELEGQTWEDENGIEHEIDLDDDEVLEYISDAICNEADYYLM